MYWYLQKPGERSIDLYGDINFLQETYICSKCKGELIWAEFKSDGWRGLYCRDCEIRYDYGDVKTKYDLLSNDKKIHLARQLNEWNNSKGKHFYLPNEKEYWYFLRYGKPEAYIAGISGGNRCLGGDEEIYDPVLNKSIPIRDINSDFHVLSWDGSKLIVSKAMKPFLKGYDYLYEVELSNGSTFVSTLGHQVLGNGDYFSIGHLLTHPRLRFSLNFNPYFSYNPHDVVTIVNVNTISTQVKPYYDFHVPGCNNYWHKGIIHHNSGKTSTCTIDAIMQLEGWHPLQRDNLIKLSAEAYDERVRDYCKMLLNERRWIKSPPVDGRVVAVDFPNGVEKFVGPEYRKWLTQDEVNYIGYDNEKKRRITWKNGSFVEFMSKDQDLDAHGGSARDFVHVDEEIPEEYWTENTMRIISTGGRMVYGATAVNGVTWTEKAIWIPGESGNKHIYTIEMSTYDNPVNTKEIIDKIKDRCRDQTEIDIRIFGKRTLRGGHVYKMYKEADPYIIEPFIIPESGYLIMAVDTHPNTPHAVLWIWVDEDGEVGEGFKTLPLIDNKPNLYEVAALFENGNIQELKRMIRVVEQSNKYLNERGHDVFLLEPGAWSKDQMSNEKSVKEQFEEDDGMFPEKGSKDLTGGIFKVQEMLTLNKNKPRLMTFKYFDAGIDYLLYEKKSYHFPDPRRAIKLGRNISNKPVDKDDHMMENERRICEYIYDDCLDEARTLDEHPALAPDGSIVDVVFEPEEMEEV
jgi:hypothetical protein